MKKVLSLALAGVMMFSALPVAYAADVDYTAGTAVSYTNAQAKEEYTVTVPASLAPGASGNVVASGTWASNRKLTVTADANVVLANSINAADTKTLTVTFAGIELAGSNTAGVEKTVAVSVAEMPSDALFGTWSGTFNYNVVMGNVA